MRKGLTSALAGFVLILAIAAPTNAGAAETIGAKLTEGGNLVGDSFVGACSIGSFGYVHDALPAARQAPGGLQPNSHGVITRWRMTALGPMGPGGGPEYEGVQVALRTYSDNGGNSYVAHGTTPVTTIPDPGTEIRVVEMPTARLPIEAGQEVGIDRPGDGVTNKCFLVDPSAGCAGADDFFMPPLALNAPGTATQGNSCLFLQADVEPDADRDGFGDETQDQCPANASTQGACPVVAIPTPAPCANLKGTARKRCLCKQKQAKKKRVKCLRRLKKKGGRKG